MSLAKETHKKLARETKSILIDCGGVLAAGETIQTIGSPTQVSPDEADDLTLTGLAINTETIAEPGRRPVPPGEGIQLFAAAGEPGLYTITIPYLTTAGQDLDALIRLRVS